MRVLILHNRYQQKGGEDAVVAAEHALLAAHGHAVRLLSVDNDHIGGKLSRITAAAGSVYSAVGARRVDEAIAEHRPDVVHVHNFFPSLSPAVFGRCVAAGVPAVHTLHNYRIQCAGATLFREGRVCELCVEQRSIVPGIRHGCYRGSRVGSAVSGLTMGLHAASGTWTHDVAAYIALTEFSADKLGRWRIPREKIFVKPNFVPDSGIGHGEGDFALFVGRLSPEKGLQTLLAADRAGLLPMDVVVAGDGPQRSELEQAAARPGSRLRPQGFCTRPQTMEWMRAARLLLLPSLWFEAGLPLVAIEAFSLGLPVIAADVGSTPGIVRAHGCGRVFPAGDAEALALAIRKYADAPAEAAAMRRRARSLYLSDYTPERNYTRLMEIYERAGARLESTSAHLPILRQPSAACSS